MNTKTKTTTDARVADAIAESEQIYRDEQVAPTDAAPLTGGVRGNRARSTVYSVRLNPDEVERLEAVAAAQDIRSSALVRGWILAGLAEHETSEQSPARALGDMEKAFATLRAVMGLGSTQRKHS